MIVTSLSKEEITTSLNGDTLVTAVTVAPVYVTTLSSEGPQGPPGDSVSADQFFQRANNFSELNTAQKKAEARTNLELQYIDCGTFN